MRYDVRTRKNTQETYHRINIIFHIEGMSTTEV